MKLVLYYHMYLTDNHSSWMSIFHEQMNVIDASQLIKNLDVVRITAIGQEKSDHKRILVGLLRDFEGPKYEIEFIQNPYPSDKAMLQNIESDATVTENVTMRKMYRDAFEYASQDYVLGYIHNKGITKTIDYVDPHVSNRYYYWRQFLNYGVIENWQECFYAIEDYNYDVSGINLQSSPALHYSGSFWWTKASHIRKLPDPSTLGWWKELKARSNDHWLQSCSDRFRDEMWVCSLPGTKAYKGDLNIDNPASVLVKRSEYFR